MKLYFTTFFITQPMLIALLFTLVIELSVLAFFKIKDSKIFLILFLVNCLTNISMNVGLTFVSYQQDTLFLSLVEVVVFGLEGLVLAKLLKNVRLGFFISFVANALSLLFGLWILPLLY